MLTANQPRSQKDISEDFLTPAGGFFGDHNNPMTDEGQLSCDVYHNDDNIIVKSAMAGVDPKNLSISVSNDILTIRGHREDDAETNDDNYYAREVYWGTFSRSIVLPQEVDQKAVKATLKKGILTIILPKKYKNTAIKVEHIED